jgi:hypothetical protein
MKAMKATVSITMTAWARRRRMNASMGGQHQPSKRCAAVMFSSP